MKTIDLTHTIHSKIPTFDGACGFNLSVVFDYKDSTPPNLFRTQKIEANCGIGTHIDAPAHCFPGGKTVDQLELDELVADCVIIKIAGEPDENFVIMPEVIEAFEKEHGEIKPESFIIFNTGWERFWETPNKYHNGNKYPSVDISTAELLLKRNIKGLGADTLSSDKGTEDFPVHRLVLGAGKYLVENIANLKDLPAKGSKIYIMPLKIKDATEAPVRLVALI